MKILHVINSLATGGAEKLLLDTIPKYNNRGIKTDLLVLQDKKHPFLQQLKETQSCKIFVLGEESVYNPLLVFKIIPFIKKYDIVHVHLFPSQYWVMFAKIFSFSKTKLLFTEHNTTNRRVKSKIWSRLNKIAYSYYNATICITKEIQTIYTTYTKLPKEKFPVIENGVDLSKIKNAKAVRKSTIHPSLKEEDKLLLQVSGFREQKDHPTLIKALQYLPKYVKVILVGDGVLKENCRQLAKELNLKNRVLFLGNRYDVPQLLKSVDVVVLSSHHEGLSLSSVEGLASGKPFVASDAPGLTNVVKDAGILFPKEDEKKLAEEINRLISDKEHYNKTVKNCLNRAKKYDITNMIEKHIKLYKDILE